MADQWRELERERTPETPEHVESVSTRANCSNKDSDSDPPHTNEERVKDLEEAQKDVHRRLRRLAAIESKVDEEKQRMARRITEASERTERAMKRATKKEKAEGKKPQQQEESSQSGSKRLKAKDFR